MSTPTAKAIYNTREWVRTRLEVLDEADWKCSYCGSPARTAHHDPALETLLAQGISPYDRRFIRSACHHCHGVEDGQRSHGSKPKPAKQNRFKSWL